MDTKAIFLWGGFILICAIIYFVSRRMKKETEENGIETIGVISRITNTGDIDPEDMKNDILARKAMDFVKANTKAAKPKASKKKEQAKEPTAKAADDAE